MDKARDHAAWNHTSALAYYMHRIHCEGLFTPEEFHPHLRGERKGLRIRDGIDILREVWNVQPEPK